MSGYYSPSQPPPGLPAGAIGPGGNGRRPNGNGPRAVALAAATVLLIATVVSFAATRSGGDRASGTAGTTLDRTSVGLAPNPSFPSGVDASGGTTSAGSGRATVTVVPPPATTTKPPAPTTPPVTTVPPPVVTMSVYGVRNVLYTFFDGFLYHRLSDIRAAVCPKYRYLYNGTYVLHPAGYEFQKWRSSSYSLLPGQNYVDIYVAVTLRNPRTGVVGGTWNHTWVITKDHSNYYVCGYL